MAPAAAAGAPAPAALGMSAGGALAPLATVGPLAVVVAGIAVAKSLVTLPTALLGLTLLAAAIAIARAVLEPPQHQQPGGAAGAAAAAEGLPSLEQALALIKGRRSIYPKDFTGEPVERAKLEAMLEAARWAPTHKKTEPWRFVVLGGAAKAQFEALTMRLCRERLPPEKAGAVLAKLERKAGQDWTKVSCYIAICMKRHADALPEWEEVCATAAAAQNLALAASACGVSGYWTSWQEAARTAPEMLEFLGLAPGSDQCLGFFVAGVADAERAACYKGARAPLDSCVEWRT